MIVGIVRESCPGEHRVALVPQAAAGLIKAGLEVHVERGAGVAAGFADEQYQTQGAKLVDSRADVFRDAHLILQVRSLGSNPTAGRSDLELIRPELTLIGFADPLGAPQLARELAGKGCRLFSMELMPRITRAQSMDALSSMATLAGYKAVLLAASTLPKMFPMMMTAAGTITAAKALIIGAGVAGLQAIATARRNGAVVQAYDVRPAAKEQCESLGAKFVELPLDTKAAEGAGGYAKEQDAEFLRKQREFMEKVVGDSDVVVTTAAVPGKKSPVLVTKEMVARMRAGSVIVDLAAERGGNCELTKADETIIVNGVTIMGPTNLPATVPYHASQMYSKNITTFLNHLVKKGELVVDKTDEITRDTLITEGGEVVNARIKDLLAAGGS
jgi:H+-translocating NAD(P) transhydrogenase subunit alpha